MENTLAIYTKDLIKAYGNFWALKGVDLEVVKGEIYGFLGPNGAGKTTTIRCLLDSIRPQGGTLRVLGIDPQKNPVEIKSRVGYLPGELYIDEHLRVDKALKYLNRLRLKRASWDYVKEMANTLDLDLKTPIKNLSKGNKQKVGVIQALMHQPELLMLDEPTFGLDPLMQKEVLRMVIEARNNGATVFFSSHILSEVQEIADKVAIIRDGVVVEVAETDILINRSMRRTIVRFEDKVDYAPLENIEGVNIISRDEGLSVVLSVEGSMDKLIKALSSFPVSDIETIPFSLEEIFLKYYDRG